MLIIKLFYSYLSWFVQHVSLNCSHYSIFIIFLHFYKLIKYLYSILSRNYFPKPSIFLVKWNKLYYIFFFTSTPFEIYWRELKWKNMKPLWLFWSELPFNTGMNRKENDFFPTKRWQSFLWQPDINDSFQPLLLLWSLLCYLSLCFSLVLGVLLADVEYYY